MENCGIEHYQPIETALNEIGLMVEKVERQRKKTIISVIRIKKNKLVALPKKIRG